MMKSTMDDPLFFGFTINYDCWIENARRAYVIAIFPASIGCSTVNLIIYQRYLETACMTT